VSAPSISAVSSMVDARMLPLRILTLTPSEESRSEASTKMTPPQSLPDEDILADHVLEHEEHSPFNTSDCDHGPLTRSRAKKLHGQVNLLLIGYDVTVSKDGILPNCCTLMLLRFNNKPQA